MTKSNIAQRNDVETSEQPPKPSGGHKRLNVFVGKWNTKGRQYG